MIKFCKTCQKQKCENCPSGYYFGWKESVTHCPNCGTEFEDIDFPAKDLAIIEDISEEVSFVEAMIKLHETDIIEYNLKMSQFKTQIEQQKQQQSSNEPHCPHCNSTNIKPISGLNRGASIAMWGIFSKKINKSFECKNCGYTW